MTPEFRNTPPDEAEVRLTALLLGEMSEADAAKLQQEIENSAELTRLCERLKGTIDLVREAVTPQAGAVEPEPKLRGDRRQTLLQHFKTVRPEPFATPARNRFSWLIPAGIAAVLMLTFAGLLLPALSRAKLRSYAALANGAGPELSTLSTRVPPQALTASAGKPPNEQLKASESTAKNAVVSIPIGGTGTAGRVGGGAWVALNQRVPPGALADQKAPTLGDQPQVGRAFSRAVSRQAGQEAKEPGASASPQPSTATPNSSSGRSVFLAGQVEQEVSDQEAAKKPKGTPPLPAQPPPAPSRPADDLGATHKLMFLKRYGLLARNSNQSRVVKNGFPSRPAAAPKPDLRMGAAYGGAAYGGYVGGGLVAGEPASVPVTNQFAPSPAISSFSPPGGANSVAVANQSANGAAGMVGAMYLGDSLVPPAQRIFAQTDKPLSHRQNVAAAPAWQPEVQTRDNPFSTFSMNVSDVSFQLAAASLANGQMPDPASIRSEEFLNAFDYRDPEPAPGIPIGFTWERARDPFEQNRDLLRFSIKTAAQGRAAGRPLNLVLLLDNSGSMERADRVQILHAALRVLASELHPQDRLSVVLFARTAYLWVDGVSGDQAGRVAKDAAKLTPQGGTNLEEALRLAYATALRHYLANGINRVVLLTDGAANLGNVDPAVLGKSVEAHRKQGVALDCFGVGWEGYNDYLLEELSRDGDGRYGFINTPEEAATDFAAKLAGALKVAALDLKVQVEFNPARVTAYRQIGYRKHQLTKEQFRDNTVAAAEIGAAESGNALYVLAVNTQGEGDLGIVRIRYRLPGTTDYREHAWALPYTGKAVSLEDAGPAMRLAATAGAFAEWLESSPYAAEVAPGRLLACLNGIPEMWGADHRPKRLATMLQEAERLAGAVQR